MRYPTHVVIDLRDGYTWAKDTNGKPLTEKTATEMAAKWNAEMKEEARTFIVAYITPTDSVAFLTATAKALKLERRSHG